ncbi:MAG: hypothetical protein JNM84_09645 [Planctomycetes bacterium]|nr:hypothetical protein [Planctomycetota bacterium]
MATTASANMGAHGTCSASELPGWQRHVETERANVWARELAIDALLELAGLRAYLGDPAAGAALVRRAIERFDAPYAAIAAQRGLEGLLGEERSRALRALAEEHAGKH